MKERESHEQPRFSASYGEQMGFICTTLLDLADRMRRVEGMQQQTLDEVRELKTRLESIEKFSSSGANDARAVINKVLTPI